MSGGERGLTRRCTTMEGVALLSGGSRAVSCGGRPRGMRAGHAGLRALWERAGRADWTRLGRIGT